jgi:hypothetical protein
MQSILSIYWTDSPLGITLWSGFVLTASDGKENIGFALIFQSKRTAFATDLSNKVAIAGSQKAVLETHHSRAESRH